MPGRRIATVLMLDVVGSTHVAAELGPLGRRRLTRRSKGIHADSGRPQMTWPRPEMPRSPVSDGPGFGLPAASGDAARDAGATYSVEPASSTGGVSGGMMPAPCSNVISPSRTSTTIVSPARNSL